jgi:hypothetical protein
MMTPFSGRHSLIVAALFALPLANAATMSRADYDAAKTRISDEYKVDDARCTAMSGNSKSICSQEAKGTEKVARADLEYSFTGTPRDQRRAQVARVDSTFAVAKEKCGLKAGNENDVCIQEAKAEQSKAMAEIKLGHQVNAAKAENADERRDADYKVALEKCDAAAGDAKDNCIAAAKLRFGKS